MLMFLLFCYVLFLQVSGENGAIMDFLMDPTGSHVSHISAALEHDGKLFLGNLAGNYVSYVDLARNSAELAGQQQRRSSVFAAAAAVLPAAAAADAGDSDQGECELCGLTGDKDVTEDEAAAAAATEGGQPVESCDKAAAGE
jgi:hypothetical protein